MQQTKNRFRLFTRHLFKFRRKKSLNPIKFFNQSDNFNNNHLTIPETPKITIEQVLNRQWMQTFKFRKSEGRILFRNNHIEESSCSSSGVSDENYLSSNSQQTSRKRITNHSNTIYGSNVMIRLLK